MTKTNSILATVVLVVMIGSVTTLAVMGRPIESLVQFFVTAALPTAIAMYGASKASKAEHNTNGRMSQLIELLREKDVDVPAGYEDVDPDALPEYVDETAPDDVDVDHPLYRS